MQQRLGFPRACPARFDRLTRRSWRALATVLVTLAAAPVAARPSLTATPTPAPAEQPALWVLSDADTTVYLFGTFHALDERADWFAPSVRAAFDSSDELMLETLVPSDPAELLGTLSRHSLAAPMVVGAPVIAGGRSPFAASAGQAMAIGRSAGLTVERGADAVLRRTADAQGKPVGGLESFDFQLTMVTKLPAAAPAARAAATPGPDARRTLLELRSAWKRGDGSSFAAVLGTLEAQSPASYRRLFVDRNNHWAQWIAERMRRPGTVFVAVGTGHLIGRDSIQQKLSRHGFSATRIH